MTASSALGFFSIAHHPVTELGEQLGCERDTDGYLVVDASGATTVPSVFAAVTSPPGLQLVQVATGSGAIAGVGCALSLENDPTSPNLRSLPTSRTRSRSPAPEPSWSDAPSATDDNGTRRLGGRTVTGRS